MLFEIEKPEPLGVENPCTPAPPGSGQTGKTCKTCGHYARPEYHGKRYRKCGLMRDHWTHGPGSDIKAKWPACREYQSVLSFTE